MSRLADYSKFDKLIEDSDDENHDEKAENTNGTTQEVVTPPPASVAAAAATATAPPTGGVIRRDESSGRYRFEYNGNPVYEFEQSLDDVTIYVLPPPYVTKGNQINCVIAANHFKLGLVGHGKDGQQEWFLNEGTYGTVEVDESTWTLEDYDNNDDVRNNGGVRRKIIVITLTKANRGTVWEAALKGNPVAAKTKTTISPPAATMDPFSKEQVKKDLMIQRFHEENPGFDFSGADFNGNIPDARDFMGGVKYQ